MGTGRGGCGFFTAGKASIAEYRLESIAGIYGDVYRRLPDYAASGITTDFSRNKSSPVQWIVCVRNRSLTVYQ
ncbi:hypothetical protein D3C75_811780 [compost metagenome]